eukprot:5294296-Karenia_brevis.AAC.1
MASCTASGLNRIRPGFMKHGSRAAFAVTLSSCARSPRVRYFGAYSGADVIRVCFLGTACLGSQHVHELKEH